MSYAEPAAAGPQEQDLTASDWTNSEFSSELEESSEDDVVRVHRRARVSAETSEQEESSDIDDDDPIPGAPLGGAGAPPRAPVVLDVAGIAQDQGAQGEQDPGASLHADQGPHLAVNTLRVLSAAFVLAVREKEALRTELGVKQLKKAKAKDLTSEQIARIAAVRAAKTEAQDRYKRARAGAKAYLKVRPSPALVAELDQIDQIYLHAEAIEEGGTAEKLDASRVVAETAATKLGIVTDTLVLSEGKFGELKRSIGDIVAAGVGSSDKSASFSVNFKVGLSKASSITAKVGLGYSGSVNIQDDRKFRVSHSLAVNAGVAGEFAGVLSASAAGELSRAKTEVFTDADHWAAVMSLRMTSFTTELYKLDQLQAEVREQYDDDTARTLLETSRLAEDPSTKVTSTKLSGSLEANALGYGAAGATDKSWMTFEKNGKKKEATQTTKSFTLKPGSNLSIALTWTNISGHANPDNNGDYWNLKLSASGQLAAILQEKPEDPVYEEWEQNLREKMGVARQPGPGGDSPILAEQGLIGDAADANDSGYAGGVAKAVSDYLSKSVAEIKVQCPPGFLAGLDTSLVKTASRAIEWNFVKTAKAAGKEGLVLQYRRVSGTKGMSASGSIPVGELGAASVSIGLSASKSKSLMVKEKLGTDTLTYLLTVFNGLGAADARDVQKQVGVAGRWLAYLDSHEAEVWAAMHLIKAGKGAAAEIRANIDGASEPERPKGVGARDWAPVATAGTNAEMAGVLLLRWIEDLDDDAEGAAEDGGWLDVRRQLSLYLERQGAFDKAKAALTWT